MYKRCKKCKNIKHIKKFDGLRGVYCLTCMRKVLKLPEPRYSLDVKSERDVHARLKREYNITFMDYEKMFIKQKGVCKICERPSKPKLLAVDHNHETGKIRGLLCSQCNTALGLLQDNSSICIRAAKYLKELI